MFYCDPCGSSRGWPTDLIFRSKGPCEICNQVSLCNDIPSSKLPNPSLQANEATKEKEADIKDVMAKGKKVAALVLREVLTEFDQVARELSYTLHHSEESLRVEVLGRLSENACELVTSYLPEHPEGWEGPCKCATCCSYGDHVVAEAP